MKKLQTLFAGLAITFLSFGAFFAVTAQVNATAADKEAMADIQIAINGFIDTTNDTDYNIDNPDAYYVVVGGAARMASAEIEHNKTILTTSSEDGEAGVAINEMVRIASRIQNQLALLQQNIADNNISGYDNTIDGFNDTSDEFATAVYDYDYNMLDSSDNTNFAAVFYIIGLWIGLCIAVGILVWTLQDKPLEQSKTLRRKRQTIAWITGIALALGIATAVVHLVTDAFPVILALVTVITGIAIIVLRHKYALAARKERPAPTLADNQQLQVSPKAFVGLNLITGGLYVTYWTWKAWQIVGKAEGKKYRYTLRAIFAVFTNFSLFKKLRTKPSSDTLAGMVFVGSLIGGIGYNIENAFIVCLLSILGFVVVMAATLPAVKAYNHLVATSKQPLFPLQAPTALYSVFGIFFAVILIIAIVTAQLA